MAENTRVNVFPVFIGAAVLFVLVIVLLSMWGRI